MSYKVDVLLGLQWGDEGKGKIVDLLAPNYSVVARFQGGPNAGHSLEFDQKKFVLHTIPSGIFQPESINYIGNGVVIDPVTLVDEINQLKPFAPWIFDNLYISKQAHLILPTHKLLDDAYEKAKGNKKIGSTLKGIGPCYTDKIARLGIRIGDILSNDFENKYQLLKQHHISILSTYNYSIEAHELIENKWFKALEQIKRLKLVDGVYFIQKHINNNQKILAEGAQGIMLDIDFGTYPYVTSSNTITAGACTGLGISPQQIGNVYGITKAYCTRVGSGPFPTELNDNFGDYLRNEGHEYGSTTGRPRRCGWIDLVALKYAVTICGVNRLIITKADVMSQLNEIKAAIAYETKDGIIEHIPYSLDSIIQPVYKTFKGWQKDIRNFRKKEDLPIELLEYIKFIEEFTNVKVEILSVGPERNANVFL